MLTSLPASQHGARTPRLCSYPAYVNTLGPEAIELAATVGLILDPWQCDVLTHGLGETPARRWAAFEVAMLISRQNGKGSCFEALELAGLVLFGDRLIVHTAHEMKTALEAFRRINALFDNFDELRRMVKKVSHQNGEEGIELLTGQRLRFLARSRGSGRGFSADRLIWDEALELEDNQVDAQMPSLSAMPNAQIWYGSSPPVDAVKGAVLMRLRERALRHDARLAYFDWGIEGSLDDLSGVDLDDERLWAEANPALGHRISIDAVQRERAAMSAEGFARERLGIWPPGLGGTFQVIPEGDWSDAFDAESEIDGPLALAAAVSLDRSRAAIAACGRRADGRLHVELTSTPLRVDNRNGTGWVVPRLVDLAARNKPAAIVMDEFGPTGSLIAAAEESGLEITRVGTAAVARAYGMFYDAVSGSDPDSRVLRHIGQPELTSAVAGAKRRPLGEGFAWDRKQATVDITPLVAVTNALYGYATRPQQDDSPPNLW